MTDASRDALRALAEKLAEIENHCPCGARPESPRTHPHVGGCPVSDAIDIVRALAAAKETPQARADGTTGAHDLPPSASNRVAPNGRDSGHLFQAGDFRLHSGASSTFKIDCDALIAEDWDTLALMTAGRFPAFGTVEGVPNGGTRFAAALQRYCTEGPLLIVDDVLTTGASMEVHRSGRQAVGAVVFARGTCPLWVTPLFVAQETPDVPRITLETGHTLSLGELAEGYVDLQRARQETPAARPEGQTRQEKA